MKVEARVHQVWDRIERWVSDHAPPFLLTLAPPATEDKLAELESVLGRVLPDDFKVSYRIHNGQILRGHSWDASRFLFDEGLRQIQGMVENRETLRQAPISKIDLQLVDTYGPLKAGWHEFPWLPFTSGDGYHSVMLDLDPPPEGTYGQVFESISDEVVNRWVAVSFVDYLESFAVALEAGLYAFWEAPGEKGIVTVKSLEWR